MTEIFYEFLIFFVLALIVSASTKTLGKQESIACFFLALFIFATVKLFFS